MKFMVFLGSARESTPPKPARLGVRVTKAVHQCLVTRFSSHEVEIVDVLDYPLGPIFKPHFAYARKNAPTALNQLADAIQGADGFVLISPEYNHSMSPALANLLNHFGSSLFSYKPSAIVTYSAGQWGGMRAAVGMRTYLSELGCLPVSAMIHVPKAQEVFTEDGLLEVGEDQAIWFDYFCRTFNQLVWWAEAARKQRAAIDPNKLVGDFKTSPSERNAPN